MTYGTHVAYFAKSDRTIEGGSLFKGKKSSLCGDQPAKQSPFLYLFGRLLWAGTDGRIYQKPQNIPAFGSHLVHELSRQPLPALLAQCRLCPASHAFSRRLTKNRLAARAV